MKILTEEEKRGVTPTEIKNDALSNEDSAKSKTFKRGLLLGDKRQYGIDGFSAPSGHGGNIIFWFYLKICIWALFLAYDSGKYGSLGTGFGLSGGGHYEDGNKSTNQTRLSAK